MLAHPFSKAQPVLTVYTGIFGKYDILHEPRTTNGLKFVCFTDDPTLTSDKWQIRYEPPCKDRHPRWQARRCKLLAYQQLNTDESLWIDGRFEFIDLIRKPNYNNILIHTHPSRICAYDEAEYCLANSHGRLASLQDHVDLEDVIDVMTAACFPKDYGLWYTSTLWRQHTTQTETLCQTWWDLISNGSIRDQVSLPFALWKTGVDFTSQPFACGMTNFHSFVEMLAHDHIKLDKELINGKEP